MIAKALMEIGDTGMKDALQRRQQDEQAERRMGEMAMQDQISRDRQEWMDQRAEAKRVTENKRYDEESQKIIDRKTAGANAEFDTAKEALKTDWSAQKDLTLYLGEIEKNRAEFIAQNSKLSEREHGEAAYRAGLLTAKEKGAMDSTVTRNEQQDRRVDLAEDRAKEDMALRKEELELRKRSEGRTSQVAALQLQEAQIKLDRLREEIKVPAMVATQAKTYNSQIEDIRKVIANKTADGSMTPDGEAKLTAQIGELSKKVTDLTAPYLPKDSVTKLPQGATVIKAADLIAGGKSDPAPAPVKPAAEVGSTAEKPKPSGNTRMQVEMALLKLEQKLNPNDPPATRNAIQAQIDQLKAQLSRL